MRSGKGGRIALVAAAGALAVAALLGVYWREIGAWVQFYWRFESLGRNAQGCPEYRDRHTEIVFVRLPGGSFTMGSPEDETDRGGDETEHDVTLRPFMISKFEVTQEEWRRLMGNAAAVFAGDKLPADDISWEDCQGFSLRTGLRLPTEAQWEYACRAGERSPFGASGNLNEVAWYYVNNTAGTNPVGQKKANGFGLHDLRGNVWEWCEDAFDPLFYRQKEATEPDPVCRSKSRRRIIRGGDWMAAAKSCRSAARGWRELDFRSSSEPLKNKFGHMQFGTTVGFRVAHPVP